VLPLPPEGGVPSLHVEYGVLGVLPAEAGVPVALGTLPLGGSGGVRAGRCHFRFPSIKVRKPGL
jgi:hypothetical protein